MRFPLFLKEWTKGRLKNICSINPKNNCLIPNSFLYIDLESVKSGMLAKEQVIEKKDAPLRAQRYLEYDDILYSCVRPYQHNNYIYRQQNHAVASTGFAVLRNQLSSDFLYCLIDSKQFENKVLNRCTGTSYPAINTADLGNIEIFYPEQNEQEKIGSFIYLLNKRIETQNKIIEKLESLKIELKERIYLSGKDKESFAKILHEKTEKSTMQNQYPVLSSTIKGLFLQCEYFDRSVASENNIGYKIVKKGQIIISPQNLWMGNLNINEKYENGIVSPSYKIYEINKSYSKKYIYWLLTSKRSFFNYSLVSEQGASIVRRNLNLDAFMELWLPVIKDANIQQKIDKLIDSIEKKINAEKKRGVLLNQQKLFLLSNLFI